MKIRTKIILILIILSSSLLYNYSNISGENWFMHPDDHSDYLFTEALVNNGSVKIDPFLGSEDFVFESGILKDGKIVPLKPVGFFYLNSVFFIINKNLFFFLSPLVSLFSIVLVFLICREFGEEKALIAAGLTAFSFFMLYWSNMEFSNTSSIFFMLGGVYFIRRHFKMPCSTNIFLSSIFFSLSFFIRYEFFFFMLVFLVIGVYHKKINLKQVILFSIIPLLVIAGMLIINFQLNGSVFLTGYSSEEIVHNQITNPLGRLFYRQFNHLFSPDSSTILGNFKEYILSSLGAIILIFTLSFIYAIKEKNPEKRLFSLPLIIILVFWSYFILSAVIWGFGKSWVGSSYTRMLIPIYIFLIIFSAPYIGKIFLYFKKRPKLIILALGIVVYLIGNISYAFFQTYGTIDSLKEKSSYKELDFFMRNTEQNSILSGNLVQKGIISRPSLEVRVSDLDKRRRKTLGDIAWLIGEGYVIYLVEVPYHEATYMDLRSELNTFEVGSFKLINQDIKIYKVGLKNETQN
jgi:hypothetical protein